MALLAIFAALSVASIIAVYSTHQLPTEKVVTTTLCTYEHRGRYYYIAKLKPNTIYNQSTIGPGKTLYIGIIDHINVTFSYKLECNRPTNTSIQYYHVNMELESPGKWPDPKVFTASEMQEIFQLTNTVESNGDASATFSIRPTEINELVNTIDKEIGTSASSTFNLNVEPEIRTVAKTDVGTINENFNPTLAIKFDYGEPDYVSMEGLQHTSPGKIERTETISPQSPTSQRFVTYMIAVASFVGLAFATWLFMIDARARAQAEEIKPVEEIIAPHEENVIEVAGEPSYKGQRATIKMKALEDLIKLADGLAQPVFHLKIPPKAPSEKPTHVFYVLDGSTKYEYRTTSAKPQK